MSKRKLIGRVSATEKYPSSCDDFQFWLADDAILSPFDIVRVENKTDGSITYGVVQDILHITDGTGHLSNYVSSDFGDVETIPMTRRLSLSYAKVSVIHNTKENFMPVFEGSPVYTADNEDIEIALGLDNIDERTAIPAGLMKASNNVAVPIKYNGDFLIGPEGAHMNISGISGLATKTSYVMFLLKAIQHKYKDDVAIIVMNVKGDDLLHIHQPNEKITPAQREEWDVLGVPCEPFENVRYLYPYRKQKDRLYANTSLPTEDLEEQFGARQAANFVYTFDHDIGKVDMLFANVDGVFESDHFLTTDKDEDVGMAIEDVFNREWFLTEILQYDDTQLQKAERLLSKEVGKQQGVGKYILAKRLYELAIGNALKTKKVISESGKELVNKLIATIGVVDKNEQA